MLDFYKRIKKMNEQDRLKSGAKDRENLDVPLPERVIRKEVPAIEVGKAT